MVSSRSAPLRMHPGPAGRAIAVLDLASHPRCGRTAAAGPAVAALLLLGALLIPAAAHGQGWIEPLPGPRPASWGVEKLRTTVSVRIVDRVAHVEVEEWFRNNGGGLAEGDYVYPLQGEAVFSGYSLYQGGEELRGELMDAGRARSIYEAIVRARRDPALIELVGKGMVRARVFPIEAGQTRRITLRYTQVLHRAGDALQFRYAAGVRHVGVMPLDAVRMPRIEPPPGVRPRDPRVQPLPDHAAAGALVPAAGREHAPLTFELVIDDARGFRDAFSPTHALRVERDGRRMTVRPAAELAGDFAVFLPFSSAAVSLTLAAHNPPGGNGYFMLTLSPGAVAESVIPRDVTMVVDVSGSMSGEKMEQARRALHQLLGTLAPEDRIRLIAFSSAVRPWREEWTRASREELRDARRWADALRAEGGTDIHGALEAAFQAASPAARLPIVVFMTDGMPTVGETRPERIAAMAESRRGRARVFVFGVGYDVNTYLLDRLSVAARGATQYVRPEEDVEAAVSLLAARIRHPVLADLALGGAPVRMTDIYPRELPDLFAGEELVLFGRYEGSGRGRLEVSGRRDSRTERFTTEAVLPARETGNDYIPRLWAARRIGDLDRRIRSAQADGATRAQVDELVEELRSTALRYGLLSEYTAYLVQEPGVVVAGVPGPAGAARGAGRRSIAAAAGGQTAVQRAEEARRGREVSSMADVAAVQHMAAGRLAPDGVSGTGGEGVATAAGARIVAGRTFVVRDGAWEDVRHATSRPTVHVEPFSPAYFVLLRALPELGLVLRELDAAVISGERVSISFATGGVESIDAVELARIAAEFRGR
jgi:Ca-activated chloride channel homolog